MIHDSNQTERLQDSILQAIETESPIQIVGGSSKSFYGRTPAGKVLSTINHQGIVNYHPSELVITARTGTSLSEIEKTLAEQGQMLAFEPPYFSPSATLGGTIACGFSGARRPFTGSVRDFVLGCKMINGQAQILSFGGEVMKNVAGYDVSRLMVGALGTLGVILEISLKVLPKPVLERTQIIEMNKENVFAKMIELAKKSLPLSGLNFDGRILYIRLSGQEKAVIAASQIIGGEQLTESDRFWLECKEHQNSFFQTSNDLWRISIPAATPELSLSGEWFYEWGGGQRWLKTTEPHQSVFALADKMQGHATLFRCKDRSAELFQPLSETLKKLNRNIKNAFDPKGVFNPHRMVKDW